MQYEFRICIGIRIVNFCNNLTENPKVFQKYADTKSKVSLG